MKRRPGLSPKNPCHFLVRILMAGTIELDLSPYTVGVAGKTVKLSSKGLEFVMALTEPNGM